VLTEEELQEIRDRKKDNQKYHNVLLAQSDRARLLAHIDHLNNLLEAAEDEKARLRRSIG
jgi:hypothetical protein